MRSHFLHLCQQLHPYFLHLLSRPLQHSLALHPAHLWMRLGLFLHLCCNSSSDPEAQGTASNTRSSLTVSTMVQANTKQQRQLLFTCDHTDLLYHGKYQPHHPVMLLLLHHGLAHSHQHVMQHHCHALTQHETRSAHQRHAQKARRH